MTTTKIAYAAATALTLTLASLASDTNLLAGRESTVVDNSSNLYTDVVLQGKIKTGTTTAATVIEIWVYAIANDATTYVAGATGSDANLSIANSGVKRLMKLAAQIDVTDTTARTYYFGGISIAQLFGGRMPKKFGTFVVHNTGANLDATGGNHSIEYVGITYTNA